MKFHLKARVCHRYKKCVVPYIDECDRFLPLLSKKREILLVTLLPLKNFKLRLVGQMRKNRRYIFHKMIIASLCCMVLAGCGHKTDPVYVPDSDTGKEITHMNR